MTRVFIYGGCTSRDTADFCYDDYGMELHSYIARQSLISAFSPAAPDGFDLSKVKGKFQSRMLAGDIAGSLPGHLETSADSIDLIVWDFMIERTGVHEVKGGGMITRNSVHRRNKRLGQLHRFGTEEHFTLWCGALEKFETETKRLGLFEKTVVNATPWALVDTSGTRPDYNAGMSPELFNEVVEAYWSAAEEAGLKVARIAQEDAVADPEHKWGPAYFHYVPETYKAQMEAITALI